MKRTVIGILAHVDAGKTTLAEAMLYCAGSIRTPGRVDHGDAFLDTFSLERERGITIFSKQAVLTEGDLQITLLDTPGHVDFSPEMERTLDILDAAILVIGGSAGVQSHTRTLWQLLRQRKIPTFLFVSKMDLPGADRDDILRELRAGLSDSIHDLDGPDMEELALCDEALLDQMLENGHISDDALAGAVARGHLFPVWFGAALKLEGVEAFLEGLCRFAPCTAGGEEFSAQIYKIARDARNVRETHLKVTGGVLRVRQTIPGTGEKITQLRIYSGAKYQTAEEAYPGDVVAAVGLTQTQPGQTLGRERASFTPLMMPVLTCQVLLPEGWDVHRALPLFRQLEEEEPQLHVETRQDELRVQIMGPVQEEILKELLETRFGLQVEFGRGSILYRETIANTVEGVGHYEPLRHYAEVHLLLEPGERGSGLEFASACPVNVLDRNWQQQVLTSLAEKQYPGVLIGAPITDMKITLASGRSDVHHTEGGDFREATGRAVRQGLMQAESVLLEPWYDFRLELPQSSSGRAMTDLQHMGAELEAPERSGDTVILTGAAPVAALQDYTQEITAYTHGMGHFLLPPRGYAPCRNQEEVVAAAGYIPEADPDNSPDSIFCSGGAGHPVRWDEVPEHMHLPSVLKPPREETEMEQLGRRYRSMVATDKELLQIFERTYGPVSRPSPEALRTPKRQQNPAKPYKAAPIPTGPEYVLVDGYNMIFAWDDLRELAREHLYAARDRLIDLMRNYQSFRQCPVILVFDAYKVPGNPGSVERYGDLSVVYTKEAQTADMYIERLSYDLGRKHRVRVATSDGLEQVIILGHGALRVSARMFQAEVQEVMETIRKYLQE